MAYQGSAFRTGRRTFVRRDPFTLEERKERRAAAARDRKLAASRWIEPVTGWAPTGREALDVCGSGFATPSAAEERHAIAVPVGGWFPILGYDAEALDVGIYWIQRTV